VNTTVVLYELANGRSPVRDFLNALPIRARAKCFVYLSRHLQEHDWTKGPPSANFTRHVRGKIFELRPDSDGVEYRLLYAWVGSVIVVLHAFKKKRRDLADSDIDLAEERLRDAEQVYR
jgi:phage-related protein